MTDRKSSSLIISSGILLLILASLFGCESPEGQPPAGSQTIQDVSNAPTRQSEIAAPDETSPPEPAPTQPGLSSLEGKVMFDDFSYDTPQEMQANGWIIREKAGWPGVPGASFLRDNVSFQDDPDQPGNRLLEMTSFTDGTVEGTAQTQFCHERKYLEGTYAARIHFSDAPLSGPDGDQVVETFYMISPYVKPNDPDYSEMDNEYLPNGGWGHGETTFFYHHLGNRPDRALVRG